MTKVYHSAATLACVARHARRAPPPLARNQPKLAVYSKPKLLQVEAPWPHRVIKPEVRPAAQQSTPDRRPQVHAQRKGRPDGRLAGTPSPARDPGPTENVGHRLEQLLVEEATSPHQDHAPSAAGKEPASDADPVHAEVSLVAWMPRLPREVGSWLHLT